MCPFSKKLLDSQEVAKWQVCSQDQPKKPNKRSTGQTCFSAINNCLLPYGGKGTTRLSLCLPGTSVFLFKLKRKKAVYTYADRPVPGPVGAGASTPQLWMEASRVFCALGRQVRGWLTRSCRSRFHSEKRSLCNHLYYTIVRLRRSGARGWERVAVFTCSKAAQSFLLTPLTVL